MQGNAQNGLDQLRDIHLPATIEAWPPAIGWWLLAIFFVALLIAASYAFIRYRKKNAPKRQALVLLDNRFARYKSNDDSMEFLSQCNQILKRFCLHYHPHAASLSAQQWTDFLNAQNNKAPFSTELLQALGQGLYQTECKYQPGDLYQACKQWIKSA